jgi:hypothetical protein
MRPCGRSCRSTGTRSESVPASPSPPWR